MAAKELYETPLLNDANLKAYYRFNSGALTTDSSGDGVTLTNNNTVGETASGKFGYAADFGATNTNKNFYANNTLTIDGGALSISMWVKIRTEPATNTNFDLAWQSNNNNKVANILRYIDESGTKKLRFNRTALGGTAVNSDYTVTLGTSDWQHIVLTYDGTNIRGYLNGSLVAGPTAASGVGTGTLTNQGISLGGHINATGNYSSIYMDDPAFFNRALTATEILDLYNGNYPSGGFFNFF